MKTYEQPLAFCRGHCWPCSSARWGRPKTGFFKSLAVVGVALIGWSPVVARADTFGSGARAFQIEFVSIGSPGNVADVTGTPNPAGRVAYPYRIAKFEISEAIIDKAMAQARSDGSLLNISKLTTAPDKPAVEITWFEAARFVNWLNTSTNHRQAYQFDDEGVFQLWSPGDAGYDPDNRYRNKLAKYFLPNAHEWYKAAYYDPLAGVYYDFPTGSDREPISVEEGTAAGTAVYLRSSEFPADVRLAGGLSPFGTMGQGGNVFEWEESPNNLTDPSPLARRAARGGDFVIRSEFMRATTRRGFAPDFEDYFLGFRVASTAAVVPEPSTVAIAAIGLFTLRTRRRA